MSEQREWRLGYDQPDGARVSIQGNNRTKAVFDELVLGNWLHIEMMNGQPDDTYWIRLGTGKDPRVFFSFVKDGVRVVRQDEPAEGAALAAELAKSKELVTLLLGELAMVPGIGWNDHGEPYYITHNGIKQQIPPRPRGQLKARAKRIHRLLEKYGS